MKNPPKTKTARTKKSPTPHEAVIEATPEVVEALEIVEAPVANSSMQVELSPTEEIAQ